MYSLLVIFAVVLVSGCQESDESKYKNAQSLMAKGQYSEAAEKFDELGSYEEATKLSMYCKAAAAGENGDFQTALSTFELLGDYKESQMMLTYYSARREESNSASMGDYAWQYNLRAATIYDTIALFQDSKDRAENCRKAAYDQAVLSAESENYELSVAILNELGSYSDMSPPCSATPAMRRCITPA